MSVVTEARPAARFAALVAARPRLAAAAAGGLGLAMPLAFSPFGAWWLTLLLPAALFALWRVQSPRAAAASGFAFGAGFFFAGTYWLYISIHVFGGAPLWLAVFLMVGLVLIMAAYFAAAGWLTVRWLPRNGPLLLLVGAPAVWVLLEWVRGWFLSGFGWLALGYAHTEGPLAGVAPVFGVYGVTGVALVGAGGIVLALAGGRRQRLLGGATLVLVLAAGWLLGRVEWTRPVGTPLPVALAQGAVSQDLKWDREQLRPTLALYRDLTSAAAPGARLIVWPEAAIPALAGQVEGYLATVRREAERDGATVILGILRHNPAIDQIENTLLALTPRPQWYVKRHLVPFGEYFPVPHFVRNWMRLMSLPYSDIAAGAKEQAPIEVDGQWLAPSICYEDLFGAEMRDFLPQASLLVNVSNDAWFGDSIAPHQHLQIARLRTLETGRPMLRATNTGISALIDHRGRIIDRSPQFEPDLLVGTMEGRSGATPFVRWGNAPVVLIAALGVLLAAWRRRRQTRAP